jgi:hypothetical protein
MYNTQEHNKFIYTKGINEFVVIYNFQQTQKKNKK